MTKPTLYLLDIGTGDNVATNADKNTPGQILRASADGTSTHVVVADQAYPDGIDISPAHGLIFWTDMGITPHNDGTVQSAHLDSSNVTTVIPSGHVHTPKQICMDHANSKLYFCDREGLRVHRCNLDGSSHEILIQRGEYQNQEHQRDQIRWCVGVAVDTDHGYFYWSQKGPSKGGQGRIFRARIDTPTDSTPESGPDIGLLFENLPESIDLDIEHDNQILYWSDRGEFPSGNTLNRAYVGGSAAEPDVVREQNIAKWPEYDTLTKHFHEAIGVKLDNVNRHIWMTDLGGSVYRVNCDGTGKERVYDTEMAFTGIALHHATPV